ncbi:hypothetical protein CJO70_03925 [Burkholderia ubonensis]|nr:hypothetical protein CJO70_03925 [Burkholderia ubonensis]PAJ95682.1 hypothetical protein CJO69_04950 [Burkholderia ubonensis]RQP68740.1 hypothetical protein DF013_28360 [Burkholderia ubonensis]
MSFVRFRLLFLCNRQDGDTEECWDECNQKSLVKTPKRIVKTNTYNAPPFSLFLFMEKLISLFANRSPRVHP